MSEMFVLAMFRKSYLMVLINIPSNFPEHWVMGLSHGQKQMGGDLKQRGGKPGFATYMALMQCCVATLLHSLPGTLVPLQM